MSFILISDKQLLHARALPFTLINEVMNATLGIGDSLYFGSVMIMCSPVALSAHYELLSLNLLWENFRGTLSSSCSIAEEYCVRVSLPSR
jgi:hypothetical protein